MAHTLVTLDSNYPELAAEVHVVNVWWLVKRGLTALLEATSASTRRRVRIYRNDDTGAEKLGIRWESPLVHSRSFITIFRSFNLRLEAHG